MARHFPMNFCPVCATPLIQQEKFGKPRPVCPACGYIYFSDPKVAAVVLIEQGDQVLLTRRAWNPAKGQWTLPGGFVDGDEDPRDAAKRECLEETGLDIEIDRLLDLYYGKAHIDGAGIIIAYTGHITNGVVTPGDDVDAVEFFSPSNFPELAFPSTEKILATWLG